jgi:asparagine synthetase B (glutamine-hydrolysing)
LCDDLIKQKVIIYDLLKNSLQKIKNNKYKMMDLLSDYTSYCYNIDNKSKQIETYDITTIRASTGQYLISKWIKENTDIKVILNGDGSDELASGYLYFYNAPNEEESHTENLRLLNQIHYNF